MGAGAGRGRRAGPGPPAGEAAGRVSVRRRIFRVPTPRLRRSWPASRAPRGGSPARLRRNRAARRGLPLRPGSGAWRGEAARSARPGPGPRQLPAVPGARPRRVPLADGASYSSLEASSPMSLFSGRGTLFFVFKFHLQFFFFNIRKEKRSPSQRENTLATCVVLQVPPATPARPAATWQPCSGAGSSSLGPAEGRGGVLQPPLYQCVGVWRRSGKPHPRTPNPVPTPPPRRLPEGPGARPMAHPGLLGRWGCRGHQGSGRPSPHTSSAAGIPHLIPDLGVRTGSQKPWVLSPDLLPGIREKLL